MRRSASAALLPMMWTATKSNRMSMGMARMTSGAAMRQVVACTPSRSSLAAVRRMQLDHPSCLKRCIAVSAENLCHQAMLMNHASCAVTSLYPQMVQVDDVVGQRAERRGLAEGAVGPVGVAEVL